MVRSSGGSPLWYAAMMHGQPVVIRDSGNIHTRATRVDTGNLVFEIRLLSEVLEDTLSHR